MQQEVDKRINGFVIFGMLFQKGFRYKISWFLDKQKRKEGKSMRSYW